MPSSEQRIVELVLKSIGDDEVRKMAAELLKLRGAAESSAESLKYLEEAGKKVGEQFQEMGAKIVAGFALEGIVEKLKGAAEGMEQLALASQKVGISVQNLQDLDLAANLTGTNVETLHKGLEILTKNMADLANKGGPATKYLRELGITAGTDVNEAFTKLSEQFAKMPDGAQKTALAMLEFGKAGAQLIPMLNESGKLLKEIDEVSDNWGTHLSDKEVAAVAEMTDHIKVLNGEVGRLTDKLLAGLAPAIDAVAKSLMNAKGAGSSFYEIGAWIGARIVELVGGFEIFKGSVLDAIHAVEGFVISAGFAGKALYDVAHGNIGQVSADLTAANAEMHATWLQMDADTKQGLANALQVKANYDAALAGTVEPKPKPGGGDVDLTTLGHQKKVKTPKEPKDTYIPYLQKQLDEYAKQVDVAIEPTIKLIDQQNKLAEGFDKAADPLSKLLAAELDISKARDSGKLSAEGEAEAVRAANAAFDQQSKTLNESSDAFAAHQAAIEKQQAAYKKMVDTWGFIPDAMATATDSIIAQTESVSQAVRRMVATLISELARLALQKLATKLLSGLFSSWGSVSAGDIAGATDFDFSSISVGAVKGFASGGVIGGPTMLSGIGMAGEAGPEMIAPLKRDSSGNMGVGAVAPHVTVNNYAGADVGVQQTPQGVQIDIMRKQLADDIARGGNPVSRALERTYGVGRYAGAYG